MGLTKFLRMLGCHRSAENETSRSQTGDQPNQQHQNQCDALANRTTNSSSSADLFGASTPGSAIPVEHTLLANPQQKAMRGPDPKDRERPIRELWDQAYQKLRDEDERLVQDFEASAGLGMVVSSQMTKREWMRKILEDKMKQVNENTWKLRVASSELEVKDMVKSVLAVVDWANDYVSKALSANPSASIAWGGISLFLPLFLNPLEQAASLAKGLEHISSLIVRSSMWEDLYVRCYESETSEAASKPHRAYRHALEMLYREILKFQMISYRYYDHNAASRLALDSVKHDSWDELLENIKYREIEFDKISIDWRDKMYTDEWERVEKRHQCAMSRWRDIGEDVSGLKQAIDNTQNDTKRKSLLSWLCEVDTSIHYNAARGKYHDGTCKWLVHESEKFKTWKRVPKSFLWLHGNAGSGKSILTSSVIDYLRKQYESIPTIALAYFFFSFRNQNQQNPTVMLSSLIRQLCASRPDTPQLVESFEIYMARGERPGLGDLEAALMATVRGFSSVFIVLDALDECPLTDGERSGLMPCLNRIVAAMPDNLHIFCTSRSEPDIRMAMKMILSSPEKAAIDLARNKKNLNDDMGVYIDSEFGTGQYETWPPNMKLTAKDLLIKKADGMFQYLVCQFAVLQQCIQSEDDILSTLNDLPEGLDETYDRLLLQAGASSKSKGRVLGSLKWLALSERPLRLDELVETFILLPNSAAEFNQAHRPFDAVDILRHFPSLVTTETVYEWSHKIKEREYVIYVKLAHFTVKEYLISDRIGNSAAKFFSFNADDAHLHIARSCLIYHLYLSAEIEGEAESFPLGDYAVRNWEWHLEKVPRDNWTLETVSLAKRALSIRSQSLKISLSEGRLIDIRRDLRDEGFDDMWRRPYCYTAVLGFLKLTKMLLQGFADTNACLVQEDLDLALLDAACGGDVRVVQFLLDEGADISVGHGQLGGALHVAARNGHLETVNLLLDRKADINAYHGKMGSALQAAASQNRSAVLELLLKRGADVRSSGCPLSHLVVSPYRGVKYRGPSDYAEHAKGLQLLMKHGADINKQCAVHGTALSRAATHWVLRTSQDAVKFLLEHGANVNLRGGPFGYPLGAACSRMVVRYGTRIETNEEVVALLSRGADVNAQGGSYDNALQVACSLGNTDVVRLLLDKGAEINKQGGRFGTALQAACVCSNKEIVDLLLEKGAEVGLEGGEYGNALQAACYHGGRERLEIMELLLEAGANVNAANGKFGSALQAAISSKHSSDETMERLLLSKGAEVNKEGGLYGTALQSACVMGKTEVVRLLLEHGSDLNIEGGKYRTALQAACAPEDNHEEDSNLVRVLIEHGADVHIPGGIFGSAWHAAATQIGRPEPNNDTLKMLLDRGVNVNDCGGLRHGTALQAALELFQYSFELIPRVRFLLDNGADVNVGAGPYCFPLQSACMVSHGTDGLDYLLSSCSDIDVNMTGGKFGTALQAAVHGGKGDAVRLLLDKGANVNARGGKYGSALDAAVIKGYRNLAEMLLERGAEINARGGKYDSALNAAVILGHWDLVEMLLERGAEPDCYQLLEPNETWLECVREKDGQGAVQRYEKFWEKQRLKLNEGRAGEAD